MSEPGYNPLAMIVSPLSGWQPGYQPLTKYPAPLNTVSPLSLGWFQGEPPFLVWKEKDHCWGSFRFWTTGPTAFAWAGRRPAGAGAVHPAFRPADREDPACAERARFYGQACGSCRRNGASRPVETGTRPAILWCILPRDVRTLTFCQLMGFPY